MSSVDRAFIRAYSKQQGSAATVATEDVSSATSPYAMTPNKTTAPLQRQSAAPISLWGAGAVVHQPQVPQLHVAPNVEHQASAATHAHKFPVMPASVVPEPTSAKMYSAWKSLPAAPIPVPAPQPIVKSGVEQLKQEIEVLRTAYSEPELPSMPVVVQSVEMIDFFANLPSNEQLSIGNYYCVIEDFNPQTYTVQTPAVSVELVQSSHEIPGKNLESSVVKSAMKKPVTEKEVAEISSTASVPMKKESAPEVPASVIPPIVESEVLWEVDQFLYPTLTDQLLQSYAYFSQAGDKLAKATASGLKVLGITGVGPGEGRTTLAICLARAAARAGLKVGLLDADFNSPSLATQLGLEIEHGWEQALIKSISLPETAVRALDDRVTLYPWVKQAKLTPPTIIDAKVKRFVEQAAAVNQLLILDLGPWREVTLRAHQRLPFDAAIVVQDLRSRQLEDVNPIAQWLHEAGVEAVGIAENFTPPA